MKIKDLLYLLVLIGISVLALALFQPYLNIILISLVIVQLFYPVYEFVYRFSKSKGFSTLISVFVSLVLIITVVTLFTIFTLGEIRNLTEGRDLIASIKGVEASINETIFRLNELIRPFNSDMQIAYLNLQDVVVQFAQSAKDQIFPIAQQALALSGTLLFNLFLMVLCLIYFFPVLINMPTLFSKISPLDKKFDLLLFQKFRDTVKGVVKGSFFVALLQATAVLIPLLALNIPAPILLWIIMMILSILPIGSGLVWFPVGMFMIVDGLRTGNTGQVIIAIALIVYSAIIINVIDTTIRPKIMKDTVNIHSLLTIFSVVGGLTIFVPMGILYGPIIIVMFLSIMDIYNKHYLNNEEIKSADEIGPKEGEHIKVKI